MKKIGLIGFGCVGQGFYEIVKEKQLPVHIAKIGIKDRLKERKKHLPFTFSPEEIVEDSAIQIIAEAIDDSEAALNYALSALRQGKIFITANKKMVAENLPLLKEAEVKNNGQLYYEAAVCGSIPIIHLLQSYYKNEEIISIEGILNGSSNYILTRMAAGSMPYDKALKEAQEKGFAEADPALDVQGYDAANKLSILSYEAFEKYIDPAAVMRRGIELIKTKDINEASDKGFKIKLIAKLYLNEGKLKSYVKPQVIDTSHPLYHVDDEYNAVVIEGKFAGKQVLHGKGAGSLPTGLAVAGDLVHILNKQNTFALA